MLNTVHHSNTEIWKELHKLHMQNIEMYFSVTFCTALLCTELHAIALPSLLWGWFCARIVKLLAGAGQMGDVRLKNYLSLSHCLHHTALCTLSLHNMHCKLNTEHCTLHTEHCTLHTTHCPLNTKHCTLHTTQCTLDTAQCTVHTVILPQGRGSLSLRHREKQWEHLAGEIPAPYLP